MDSALPRSKKSGIWQFLCLELVNINIDVTLPKPTRGRGSSRQFGRQLAEFVPDFLGDRSFFLFFFFFFFFVCFFFFFFVFVVVVVVVFVLFFFVVVFSRSTSKYLPTIDLNVTGIMYIKQKYQSIPYD